MPLYESYGPARGGLTREQKRQEEAAIYGLQGENNLSTALSPAEIERLRQIVADHDRQHGPPKEFDLNRPPKEPYQYQEFPRMLYHHERRETRIVKSEYELALALEDGWRKEAFLVEVPEPVLDVASQREVEEINEKLAQARKKK